MRISNTVSNTVLRLPADRIVYPHGRPSAGRSGEVNVAPKLVERHGRQAIHVNERAWTRTARRA